MSAAVGNVAATTIEWVARALMQIAQLKFAREVSRKQFELAQEYSDRAKSLLDRQLAMLDNDNGRWFGGGGPCLDGFLGEVCGVGPYTENYLDEAARTLAPVRMQSSLANKKIIECADTHCVGMTVHMTNELALREAALATSSIQLAFRREEVDVERKNAVRLANKAQGIAMAKGAMNGSSAGLAGLTQSYLSMAKNAGEGMNSSLQSMGFQAQSLITTLARNPFTGKSADPTNESVMQSRDSSEAITREAGFQGTYSGVNTTNVMGVSNASSGSWGADPMQGAYGTDGSQGGGSDTGDGGQTDSFFE